MFITSDSIRKQDDAISNAQIERVQELVPKKVAAGVLSLIVCAAATVTVLTLTATVALPPVTAIVAIAVGAVALLILLGGTTLHCARKDKISTHDGETKDVAFPNDPQTTSLTNIDVRGTANTEFNKQNYSRPTPTDEADTTRGQEPPRVYRDGSAARKLYKLGKNTVVNHDRPSEVSVEQHTPSQLNPIQVNMMRTQLTRCVRRAQQNNVNDAVTDATNRMQVRAWLKKLQPYNFKDELITQAKMCVREQPPFTDEEIALREQLLAKKEPLQPDQYSCVKAMLAKLISRCLAWENVSDDVKKDLDAILKVIPFKTKNAVCGKDVAFRQLLGQYETETIIWTRNKKAPKQLDTIAESSNPHPATIKGTKMGQTDAGPTSTQPQPCLTKEGQFIELVQSFAATSQENPKKLVAEIQLLYRNISSKQMDVLLKDGKFQRAFISYQVYQAQL